MSREGCEGYIGRNWREIREERSGERGGTDNKR